MISSEQRKQLMLAQTEAEKQGWQCVVGGIIFSPDQKVYLQKRSPNKSLFPNCWDMVGGHVEFGESLQEASRREVLEETGWQLRSIDTLIQQTDWNDLKNGERIYRREFDFILSVDGDLEKPLLETENFTEGRWLNETEFLMLKSGRLTGEDYIFDVVEKAFAFLKN